MTDHLSGYVRRKLYSRLGCYTDRIERITLVLEENKESPPGLAYKSQIRVKVAHLPVLVIEECGAYLYHAVDSAAGRAGRELARTIHSARDSVPFDCGYGFAPDYSIAPRFREWIACRGVR